MFLIIEFTKSLIFDIKITYLVADCAYSSLDYLQIALDKTVNAMFEELMPKLNEQKK